MASHLTLECPSSHDIYFNLKGEAFFRPMSASVILKKCTDSDFSRAEQVQVSLVRVLSSKSSRDCASRNKPFLKQVCRLLSSKARPTPSETTQTCSVIEEMALCVPNLSTDSQVGYSPNDGKVYRILFHMPITPNMPASAATDLGNISYFLAASLRTSEGNVLGTSQEISFTRQLIPDCNTDIQHIRNYPNGAVVAQINLSQQIDSTESSNISLDAKILLRRPVTPATRPTEFKSVAIRGIRWRVEEITKLFIPPEDLHQPEDGQSPVNQSIEKESTTRELFNGFQKGYWVTFQNPIVKGRQHPESNHGSPIEIKLDIPIPKDVTPTPEISLSNYIPESMPAQSVPPSIQGQFPPTTPASLVLTVEHRLRFDLLTSEDTFDVDNHNLVDGRPLRTVLNISFPLLILRRAHGRIDETVCQGNPPSYDEVPVSPPDYKDFAQPGRI
ncbi:uncharacterized protein N7458_007304 [Penicillium daleae]|uniref:LDB19 N-terminal domain-containing protein n=1 Tax=Penicillium daleae TaxID=63821 RepID=A0AAD6C0B9_9EURO|nr:uncharacterized protein N7458_007304 [Penicillium daleae]KAJ5443432.1 hypothetical protein N7458_007304 [Penicillium daleae]